MCLDKWFFLKVRENMYMLGWRYKLWLIHVYLLKPAYSSIVWYVERYEMENWLLPGLYFILFQHLTNFKQRLPLCYKLKLTPKYKSENITVDSLMPGNILNTLSVLFLSVLTATLLNRYYYKILGIRIVLN